MGTWMWYGTSGSRQKLEAFAPNPAGQTPLSHAWGAGHLDVVRYICEEAKFDSSATNPTVHLHLAYACGAGHLDTARYVYEEAER